MKRAILSSVEASMKSYWKCKFEKRHEILGQVYVHSLGRGWSEWITSEGSPLSRLPSPDWIEKELAR